MDIVMKNVYDKKYGITAAVCPQPFNGLQPGKSLNPQYSEL
jgi:hypothetical protein